MEKSRYRATNDWAISFAENQTLRAFVALYSVMSIFILALLGVLYYRYQSEIMLAQHRLAMQLQMESYLPRVLQWVQGDVADFPKDQAYKSAFFINTKQLEGEIDLDNLDLSYGIHKDANNIYFVITMGSYGLKDAVVVMQTTDDRLWFKEYLKVSFFGGGSLFLALFLLGVWLSKLFLRPMRDAVAMLDDFIKDTTHELNTPLTTILTNIELIEKSSVDHKSASKLHRIEIAARTIEVLYDDLTYLLLGKKIVRKDEPLDFGALIRDRCEYFKIHQDIKKLEITITQTNKLMVVMDKKQATRVIDNLLSNAIKYSDRDSTIQIDIAKYSFSLANTGPPIQTDMLDKIFRRYVRAEVSKGGFGIGLHIVNTITTHYGIKIDVTSQKNRTIFHLDFKESGIL